MHTSVYLHLSFVPALKDTAKRKKETNNGTGYGEHSIAKNSSLQFLHFLNSSNRTKKAVHA